MNPDPSITPPEEPDPELGRAIRDLREAQGLSRADLASDSQVDPAALAAVEDGATDPPWATVEAIARGLGVSVQSLADAAEARRPRADG